MAADGLFTDTMLRFFADAMSHFFADTMPRFWRCVRAITAHGHKFPS